MAHDKEQDDEEDEKACEEGLQAFADHCHYRGHRN